MGAEKPARETTRKDVHRLLFEAAPVGISIVGLDGRLIDANRCMQEMLGVTMEELRGARAADLCAQSDEWPALVKTLKSAGQVRDWEMTLKRADGRMISALLNVDKVRIGGRKVLLGSARDITERKQGEERLRKSFEEARRTLEGGIEAMALAVEMRDEYTAGHQRRVAELAQAIAGEMQFSEELIRLVGLAGMLHDIGKIRIPAEILSKPGRMSPSELGLMQMHCEAGYEILCKIETSLPIAQIVLQHHERLDGTGYPSGLSNEAIRLESRIISVADVVEAMAHHRPYRPALGISAAIGEIQMHAGGLYDRHVAQACERLLADERFEFKSRGVYG